MNFLSKYKLNKTEIKENKLTHVRALVRVDYNVPFKKGKIVDTRRITASFKTIDKLLNLGIMPVLLAHLGEKEASLEPVYKFLKKNYKVVFLKEDISKENIKNKLNSLEPNTIVLLENIRRYQGEEKNDKDFAKRLASLADLYINDAFSVSHRAHASVVSLPKFLPHFAGFQLEREVKELTTILKNEKHPFLFILGGAKFATKIPLLSHFEKKSDSLIIAGAILNSFYKVAGFEIGKSISEDGYEKTIKKLLKNPKILLPVDVIVERSGKRVIASPASVLPEDIIVDIGPQTIDLIGSKIKKSKVFVWNGPLGWYEKGHTKGTIEIAKIILESNIKGVIGGGDTGAVIEKIAGNTKKIFISTGGGATIDFLAKGNLPGIKALK